MGFSSLTNTSHPTLCHHLRKLSYCPWKLPSGTCRKASTFHHLRQWVPLLKLLLQGETMTQFDPPPQDSEPRDNQGPHISCMYI